MRKFLSLVLALVMMMSLITINTSAVEFNDGDDISSDAFKEAIDVISTIHVVDGYENGNFNPSGNLTRGAAAKIICNLILGPTTASQLHADTAPFRDVPVNHDFAGYIAYCQKEGIIGGYGDGTYRPAGTLTGNAFMKMLLGALGYDAEIEQYGGPNWSINVAKRAIGIGLDKGLVDETFNGAKFITREEACLYAFNTLQADLVKYDQKITANVNGAEVTVGNSLAESRKWDSQRTRIDNIREDEIIQFAEEYFNKLEKKRDTDDFERPSYTWVYDKDEIGTYVNYELLQDQYTTGVTGRDLYDLLGSTTLRDNKLAYYVDGQSDSSLALANIYRGNQNDVGKTGDGVLTQVFLDKDREELTITSINTYLGQVTADYNEDREYAPIEVYITSGTATGRNIDREKVSSVVDAKEDDWYLTNISWKNDVNGEVVFIQEPEILEGETVTKFSASNEGDKNTTNRVTKLTVGGTEYKQNVKHFYADDVLDIYNDELLTDKTYNIFLDQYGYFIGVEEDEGVKNYVFITGFDRPRSNLSVKTADAAAIFLDGTMQEIKVNVKDTDKNIRNTNALDTTTYVNKDLDDGEAYFIPWDTITSTIAGDDGMYALNRWFTYRVNSDGIYTLTPAKRMLVTDFTAATTLKTANLNLNDTIESAVGATAPRGAVGVNTSDTSGKDPYAGVQGLADKNAFGDGGGASSAAPEYIYHHTNNRRAYGNDDTVYLTVDTDIVDTSGANKYAITDVNGVYTGIQNVEIEITAGSLTVGGDNYMEEAQVWSVYDSDNYIIASVTTGEAKGGNATIAYVLSGPKSERREDNYYYWEFDAVVDGQDTTLTVKENFDRVFEGLVRLEADKSHKSLLSKSPLYGENSSALTTPLGSGTDLNLYDGIVELRFDANKEYVTSIKAVEETDILSNYGIDGRNVGGTNKYKPGTSMTATGTVNGGTTPGKTDLDIADAKAFRANGINQAMIGASTWTDSKGVTRYYDSAPETLNLKGRTLYLTYGQTDCGVALASDAKAVTVQYENGDWRVKTHNSVSAAIAQLAMRPGTTDRFDGEVMAAMGNNGQAQWLVFTNYNPLTSGTPVQPGGRVNNISVQYFDPNGVPMTGDEFVGFVLWNTVANRSYTVTLTTYLPNGALAGTRTMTVSGKAGFTKVLDNSRMTFYGNLDAGTQVTVSCEDGIATYVVQNNAAEHVSDLAIWSGYPEAD